MSRGLSKTGWAFSLALVVGCGPLTPSHPADAGADAAVDAGELDAGTFDAGLPDAGLCGGALCPPERITGELIDPWDLVVDDANVYWLEYGLATNGSDGMVMQQAKDTRCLKRDAGCAQDLNTRYYGRQRVETMTLAQGELCWTEGYDYARDVVCQSLTTRLERTLARNQAYATEPTSVDGKLLWVNETRASGAGLVSQLALDAPASTVPTIIARRQAPTSVAGLDGSVAWSELGPLLPDGGLSNGAVVASVPGVGLVTVGAAQGSPRSLKACGEALYWVNYSQGLVMRGTLAPDSGVPVVMGQKHPFDVACDATHLFWLNAGVSNNGADGELWQARLDGSEAKVMTQGIALAVALALDDTYAYYIAQGTVTRLDGVIWRMRKHP
jgi:hypothetical protein